MGGIGTLAPATALALPNPTQPNPSLLSPSQTRPCGLSVPKITSVGATIQYVEARQIISEVFKGHPNIVMSNNNDDGNLLQLSLRVIRVFVYC
jgi:hypothetical protein